MFMSTHDYFNESFGQGRYTELWIMEKEISQSNENRTA